MVTKKELSKNAKLSVFKSVFVPILTCGHESEKNTTEKIGLLSKKSSRCDTSKTTGLKSVKPGMSSHFSESRDPSYVSSAMCPECPRKEWRTKSFRPQSSPTGKRPKFSPRTRWHDYISDFAWSRLNVESEKLSEIAVDREVFRVFLGLLPQRLSPKEKRARKWVNKWVFKPILNLSVYEIVCGLFAKSECRI